MIDNPGERIAKFRLDAGYSQEDLSRLLAKRGLLLSESVISRLENNTRQMKAEECAALADIFKVSMDCICRGICSTNRDFEMLTKGLSANCKKLVWRCVEHNINAIKEQKT